MERPATRASNKMVNNKPNVFLFVPNIIGYIRILLLGFSFHYMLSDYKLALLLYSTSCLLDAFDGLAARLFNQSSVFGGMLDMLTDRVSTMCLLMTLGHLYPKYFFVIQLLLAIDIVSHWLHFFSANLQGKTSHKVADVEAGALMRIYYENKLILTSVCALEQLFYCSLVVYKYETSEKITSLLVWPLLISVPGTLFKNYINLVQIKVACQVLANSSDSKNK